MLLHHWCLQYCKDGSNSRTAERTQSGPVRAPVGGLYFATCTMAISIAGPEISARPSGRDPRTSRTPRKPVDKFRNKWATKKHKCPTGSLCLLFSRNCLMSFLVFYIFLIWLDRLGQLQSSAMPGRLLGKQRKSRKPTATNKQHVSLCFVVFVFQNVCLCSWFSWFCSFGWTVQANSRIQPCQTDWTEHQ